MRNYQESEIPHGETYLCNDALLDERHSAGNSVKNVGTQIYDHDSDLCQGDKPMIDNAISRIEDQIGERFQCPTLKEESDG